MQHTATRCNTLQLQRAATYCHCNTLQPQHTATHKIYLAFTAHRKPEGVRLCVCLTYEWVMSQIWISHISHMNESCLTYVWVMSHIWMSHVSSRLCVCLTSVSPISEHARMHAVPRWLVYAKRLKTAQTTERLAYITASSASRAWMSLTYEWVMSHIWMSHVSHIGVRLRDMTHPYVRYDSCMCVCVCVCVCEGARLYDMTHSYVKHDSFMCVTRLIHIWDMTTNPRIIHM